MRRLTACLAIGAVLLAGCATAEKGAAPLAPAPDLVQDTVVLLPNPSGGSGAVAVGAGGHETVLDSPYAGAEVTADGKLTTRVFDPAEVNSRFGGALSAQPPRPVSFILYFLEGKNELTPESTAALDKVKTLLATWPAPEINIIGHTDTVGGEAANDALSLERAEMVKKMLAGLGLDGARILAVGRGERELLVPTADGVSEEKNRRVEISVR